MEQTKGYLRMKGKIWGLNTGKVYETDFKKNISFGIQTCKDNTNFISLGEWKNSTLNVKVKSQDMEEVVEMSEQDLVNDIKTFFKDGDSVYVNCRVNINTYTKKLEYKLNQIYIEKEPINFNSDNFEETCEMIIPAIIIEKPKNEKIHVGFVDYRGNMMEQELIAIDDVIKDYFVENIKVGDLTKLFVRLYNKPVYKNGESSNKVVKTLKKGVVDTANNQKRADSHELQLQITDIETNTITSGKYSREEIRKSLEVEDNTNEKEGMVSDNIEDEDLPF